MTKWQLETATRDVAQMVRDTAAWRLEQRLGAGGQRMDRGDLLAAAKTRQSASLRSADPPAPPAALPPAAGVGPKLLASPLCLMLPLRRR